MFQKSRLRASNSLDVLAFFSSIFHEENLATKNNRERINGSNDGDSVSRTKILFLIDFFFHDSPLTINFNNFIIVFIAHRNANK